MADLDVLLQIPRLSKVLLRVGKNYDVSGVMNAIVMAVVNCEGAQDEELAAKLQGSLEKLLKQKGLLNLKTQYQIISSLLQFLVEHPSNPEQKHSHGKTTAEKILELLKSLDSQCYNQTILYHLKQTQDTDQKNRLR